jgi:ribosomal protein S18 acetylase RimI-like enzyme
MQYLDNRMLPGYAAIEAGRVIGYVFCVYEGTKAVIGDVFAMPGAQSVINPVHLTQNTLLRHLFELLQNSPHVDRIESQMLLHPSGTLADAFSQAGFQLYRRLYLVEPLNKRWSQPKANLPAGLELRSWNEADLAAASRLICTAYGDHPDGLINDQYRSAYGAMRFLNNIVHYAGCGNFSPQASYVLVERASHELAAMVLSSRISDRCGHLTQVCVHPGYRRHGLARLLLAQAAFSLMRHGAAEVSLTVTESNSSAVKLYKSDGYQCAHNFDAAVWQREISY